MANEKRLIYLDEALKATHSEIYWTESQQAAVRNFLVKLPTVDAVEVVHGRWEYWAGGLPRCLVCGYEYTDYVECKNYCGNCGAKMDGGNEDG